jgi:hypothetical protein
MMEKMHLIGRFLPLDLPFVLLFVLPFVAVLASAPAAAGPQLSPVTDRNYSIELYDGAALGNATVIGMGGAAVALASGSSGTLQNPAAPAVRPTTDTNSWAWDCHLDALVGSLSTDYDNNGIVPMDTSGTGVITAGLALRYHDWATAVTLTDQYAPLAGTASGVTLRADVLRFQFAIAKWIPQLDTAIGVSVQSARFDLGQLFEISGGGLEAGATWIPRWRSIRIGAALASPIVGGSVTNSLCDPSNCLGFILPESIVTPWRLASGLAYRWAETEWNQQVGGWFRDEPSLTVAADLVIVGASADAFGLEAFGMHELQRSGRHTALSLRGGADYEWLPGRLRVRGGSYWEPGRFEGVSGRLHGTFGIELRVLQFMLWGELRRGKLGFTADVASQYKNAGFSIGLWH